MTTITTTTSATITTTTLIPFPLNCGREGKGRSSYCRERNEIPFDGETQRGEGQLASRQTFRRHTSEACLRRKVFVSLSVSHPPPPFPSCTPARVSFSNSLAAPCPTRSRSKRHGGKRARRKRDDMPRFGHATPIDTVEPLFLA